MSKGEGKVWNIFGNNKHSSLVEMKVMIKWVVGSNVG